MTLGRGPSAVQPGRPRSPYSLSPDVPRGTFADDVLAERSRLALLDPEGELEAIAPVDGVRARQRLLDQAARRRPEPLRPGDRRPDGRELLERLGADPNRGRGVVKCPAHDDRGPSLSWRLADDGRALVHCFAGCSFTEILEAIR